jgi:hypothetical protein
VAPRTVTQSAGSYDFLIVVVIIRYKPTAAARWASLFIIRTFFNNAFTITVWTRFLCHVNASESLACGLTTTPEKKSQQHPNWRLPIGVGLCRNIGLDLLRGTGDRGCALQVSSAAPIFLLKDRWPRPLWGLGGLGIRSGPCSQGTESDQIIALLPDLQICKFVKAYAHNPVNLDAVAAFSSASFETTGVGVSIILAGGFQEIAIIFMSVLDACLPFDFA